MPDFLANLKRGQSLFEDAARTPGFRPAHAQFALGVIDFLESRYSSAARRLDEALTVFNGAPDVYGRDATLQLANLYLGLSICHAMEGSGDLRRARDAIVSALSSGARLPIWLIADTIDAPAATRNDIAEDVANIILEHTPEALDEILRSSSAPSAPGIVNALSKRAADAGRPQRLRTADYRLVIPLHLDRCDVERAKDALAYLEEAAAEGFGREEFLALLESEDNYCPAWTTERVAAARIYLLESQGRLEEAAVALESACWPILASRDEYALDDAELIALQLESYGPVGVDPAARIRSQLDARISQRDCEVPEASSGLSDLSLRVLVVGGNETQVRMQDDIIAELAAEFPRLTVEFLPTGWSGNWAHFADEFSRRVRGADGVVFLSLMRTMLGRTLRQRCAVPRAGCGRGGRGAIVGTIRRLLPMAASHLERHRAQLEAQPT